MNLGGDSRKERGALNTLTLYHGTTSSFTEIDVSKGKPFKDFGQGFYATELYDHARNLALRNLQIERSRLAARGRNARVTAFICSYEFDLREMGNLKVKHFALADKEWLKFVIQNRLSQQRQHDYDLVIGPTANDDTRTSIRMVTNAANGAILSDAALDLLLLLLEPGKLPVQYYFGSDHAARLLKFKMRSVV
jgi:hypothetical protein